MRKTFLSLFLAFGLLGAVKLQSQVVVAPNLVCVSNANASSDIILVWGNAANGCGAFVCHQIFGATTLAGPYTMIACVSTQGQSTYTHVAARATSGNWFYFMRDSFNCAGATVLNSDTIQNANPLTPTIVKVTVVNGRAVFTFNRGASPQTSKYIIQTVLNAFAVPIDTVYGRNDTVYVDNRQDPNSASLTYTVTAVDSCNHPSAFNVNPHSTVWLQYKTAVCDQTIKLNWTKYKNWSQNVKAYRVMVNKNSAGYSLAGTTDTATLSFDYTGFTTKDSLCFYIEAISRGDTTITSNSNEICIRPLVINKPRYIYVSNITVDLNNYVHITWLVDSIAQLLLYTVNTSISNSNFQVIKQENVPVPLTFYTEYIDSLAQTTTNVVNYYGVSAIDSCNSHYNTPTGATINLTGDLSDYYRININWTPFQLYGAYVLRYNIYRDYGVGLQYLATVDSGTYTFNDSLFQFLAQKGKFCYRIEAVYVLTLPNVLNGFVDTLSSFSNTLCILHRPIIYVPNAFVPNGLNNVFKPFIQFGDPQGYTMTIFSRWGAKIFVSTDPAVGWDGTEGGKQLPLGGYAYLIHFTAADGTEVERSGIVLLVK